MATKQQIPDEQVIRTKDQTEIRYGTPLYRLNESVSDQPQDQEQAEFLVGDIRDVCAVVKDKNAEELRASVKGKRVQEFATIPITAVKQLISAALKTAR